MVLATEKLEKWRTSRVFLVYGSKTIKYLLQLLRDE
jgi:hypothetical protein